MVFAAVLAVTLALTATQSSQIDAIVSHVMSENAISGCTLGAARAGRPLFLRGYGNATPQTIYPIGSLTKQFTAALVLRAIASHELSFDTIAHGATVEQLMNQTSGIPDYAPGGRTLADALAAPLEFKPGARWAYSNTNYVILASLLESQTHTPFANLVRDQFLIPLRLSHTVADGAHGDLGMTSSASDILDWLDALESGRVVPTADLARMTEPAHLSDGSSVPYGYAFFIRNWYGWNVFEHPGYVTAASADDALLPQDHLALVALCDRGPVSLEPLLKSIVAILEPPRDRTLVATIGASPENERIDVRHRAEALVATLGLGVPRTLEFLSRVTSGAETQERYRVTFEHARYRLTLIYRNGAFQDATIGPVSDE